MNRRQCLASAILFVGTAGCLETLPGDEPPAVTTLEGDDVDPPLFLFEHELGVDGAEDASPATVLRVGDSPDSHWVVAMADTDESLETTVVVHHPSAAADDDGVETDVEPLSEETVDLSRSSYAAVQLRDSNARTVGLEWDGGEWARTVPAERIDCNASNDSVLLDPDGTVERTGETTAVDC